MLYFYNLNILYRIIAFLFLYQTSLTLSEWVDYFRALRLVENIVTEILGKIYVTFRVCLRLKNLSRQFFFVKSMIMPSMCQIETGKTESEFSNNFQWELGGFLQNQTVLKNSQCHSKFCKERAFYFMSHSHSLIRKIRVYKLCCSAKKKIYLE